MKFKDKLPKLRKNNNITQEQLADMLGVSRQAVSKWESGLSIPDMEKIIEMCKIFNCQIEELLDDGVTSNQTIEREKTIKEQINSILNFITKTYKMFCSMKFLEKIKCLFELCFIVGFQILIFLILGSIFKYLLGNIFDFLPWKIYNFFGNITSFIYFLITFIIGFIITIHLFKVRYLNYFVIVKDKIEKTTEEEKYILDKQKETIIIRDLKDNSSLSNKLKKLMIILLKCLTILLALPLIIFFVIMIFFTISFLIYLKNGLIFFGVLLICIGITSLIYIILEYLYCFLFNIKKRLKKIFIILILSLVLIGSGASITFSEYLTFIKIDNNLTMKKDIIKVDLNDKSNIYIPINKDQIVIDDSVDGVEIYYEYLNELPRTNISYGYYCDEDYEEYPKCSNKDYYFHMYSDDNFIFILNLIIKDFKNKNIRNYNDLQFYKITEIRVSKDNLDKIKY